MVAAAVDDDTSLTVFLQLLLLFLLLLVVGQDWCCQHTVNRHGESDRAGKRKVNISDRVRVAIAYC